MKYEYRTDVLQQIRTYLIKEVTRLQKKQEELEEKRKES